MGGRGASFSGTYTPARYGNQYSPEEIIGFGEAERILGIEREDREISNLMQEFYDRYKETNPSSPWLDMMKSWNQDIRQEIQNEGITIDDGQFLAVDYDLTRAGNAGSQKFNETTGDVAVYTGMYRDVQDASGDVTHIQMERRSTGSTIRYELDNVAVTKNLSTGTYSVTHEDGSTATFTTMAEAREDAKKNGQPFALPL